jgi:hypothetical protein
MYINRIQQITVVWVLVWALLWFFTFFCMGITERKRFLETNFPCLQCQPTWIFVGDRGRDCMVTGFITTYAISAYHHWCCEFESPSGRGELDTALCDKVCQWLATSQWFSPGSPVFSPNKTIILLKVAFNTIKPTIQTKKSNHVWMMQKKNNNLTWQFSTWNKLNLFKVLVWERWNVSKIKNHQYWTNCLTKVSIFLIQKHSECHNLLSHGLTIKISKW